jgi:hypothetical protein
LLVLSCAAMPASAFASKKLDINVLENGDANIQFQYQLSWPEKFGYTLVPQKEQIVSSAIQTEFPTTTVTNVRVSKSFTDLTIKNFASVSTSTIQGGAATTYKTPAVSFLLAKHMLDANPLIRDNVMPDYSPGVTTVRFAHGVKYTYNDVTGIPAITYTTMK